MYPHQGLWDRAGLSGSCRENPSDGSSLSWSTCSAVWPPGVLSRPGEQGLPGMLWLTSICKFTSDRVQKRRPIKSATTWNAFRLFPPPSVYCPGLQGNKSIRGWSQQSFFSTGIPGKDYSQNHLKVVPLKEPLKGPFKGSSPNWLSYQLMVPIISEFI